MPLTIGAPRRDMVVTKRGRTTGVTKGKIIDTDFRFILNYGGVGKVGFTKQVLCERYTDGGDSGSLVVDTEDFGKVVGLHFAGANGGSVFNPIQSVVKDIKICVHSQLVRGSRRRQPKNRPLARDRHQDKLTASGAHSLSVEPVSAGSGEGFWAVVVAWVDRQLSDSTSEFPSFISIDARRRSTCRSALFSRSRVETISRMMRMPMLVKEEGSGPEATAAAIGSG